MKKTIKYKDRTAALNLYSMKADYRTNYREFIEYTIEYNQTRSRRERHQRITPDHRGMYLNSGSPVSFK